MLSNQSLDHYFLQWKSTMSMQSLSFLDNKKRLSDVRGEFDINDTTICLYYMYVE